MASRDLIVNFIGNDQLGGVVDKVGKGLNRIGGALTKTLTPAALGAGLALKEAGQSYQDGMAALRAGTGATGEQLANLESSMKGVARQAFRGGVGMDEVGSVMADVNTNMGVTGGQLETLTTRFLQLDRLGMGASIEGVNRAFGDWSVSTEDQAGVMDRLFRQAQFSGIGIDELADKVVAFGAPLRNLGFDMDEAIALFGKWGKEGVNTETIMGGLRAGIGKLAKEGKDVPKEFRRIIESIGDAGSASEATAIAIEAFGQRAGPDLADAVRGGKFELEEFLAAMESGDTIEQAAKDTLTLTDRIRTLGQRFQVLIGPVGEIGSLFAGVAAGIGPVLLGLGQMGPVLGSVGAAFSKLSLLLLANPFVALTAALVAIGTLIFFHRDKVLGALSAAWEKVSEVARDVWNKILGFFEDWWPLLLGVFTGGIGLVVGLVIKHWDEIKETTERIWGKITDFLEAIPDKIVGFFSDIGDKMFDLGEDILGGLKDGAVAIWNRVVESFWEGIPGMVLDAIGNVGGVLEDVGGDILGGLKKGAENAWNAVVESFWEGLPGMIADAIPDMKDTLRGAGRDILEGFLDGMQDGWQSIIDWFRRIPRVISDAGNTIASFFKAPINVIIDGINAIQIPSFSRTFDPLGPFGPAQTISFKGFDPIPDIPRLARGGVAFDPQLAVIGDNRGARRDPEIVSPQSLMVDAFRKALREEGGGPSQTIIVNTPFGDERKLARKLSRESARRMRLRGDVP